MHTTNGRWIKSYCKNLNDLYVMSTLALKAQTYQPRTEKGNPVSDSELMAMSPLRSRISDAWVFAILLALLCRRHPGSYQKLPIGYQPSNRSMARMSINDATGRGLMRELLQSSCSHRGRQWAFVAPLIAADAGLPLPYAPRSGARRTERELWRAPSSVPLRQGEDVVADGGLDRHPVRGGAVPLAVAAKAFPVFPQRGAAPAPIGRSRTPFGTSHPGVIVLSGMRAGSKETICALVVIHATVVAGGAP